MSDIQQKIETVQQWLNQIQQSQSIVLEESSPLQVETVLNHILAIETLRSKVGRVKIKNGKP
jgi:hypothetical protein